MDSLIVVLGGFVAIVAIIGILAYAALRVSGRASAESEAIRASQALIGKLREVESRPAPALTVNAAGVPVFSLEAHLASHGDDFALLPDVPRTADVRYALGWTPKNDCVFVLGLQEADRSRGGIIAPDDARQRPHKGIVLAVGGGLWDAEQERLYPVEASVGDLVTYGHYSGEAFELEGLEVLIVRNVEIKGRKRAGTYQLTRHHLDVGGLHERHVYHEPHTYCEHCAAPVNEVLDAEREQLREANRAALGFETPAVGDAVPPLDGFITCAECPSPDLCRMAPASCLGENAVASQAPPPAPAADDEASRRAIAEERARLVAERNREDEPADGDPDL